jgi:hypothetical protein
VVKSAGLAAAYPAAGTAPASRWLARLQAPGDRAAGVSRHPADHCVSRRVPCGMRQLEHMYELSVKGPSLEYTFGLTVGRVAGLTRADPFSAERSSRAGTRWPNGGRLSRAGWPARCPASALPDGSRGTPGGVVVPAAARTGDRSRPPARRRAATPRGGCKAARRHLRPRRLDRPAELRMQDRSELRHDRNGLERNSRAGDQSYT